MMSGGFCKDTNGIRWSNQRTRTSISGKPVAANTVFWDEGQTRAALSFLILICDAPDLELSWPVAAWLCPGGPVSLPVAAFLCWVISIHLAPADEPGPGPCLLPLLETSVDGHYLECDPDSANHQRRKAGALAVLSHDRLGSIFSQWNEKSKHFVMNASNHLNTSCGNWSSEDWPSCWVSLVGKELCLPSREWQSYLLRSISLQAPWEWQGYSLGTTLAHEKLAYP